MLSQLKNKTELIATILLAIVMSALTYSSMSNYPGNGFLLAAFSATFFVLIRIHFIDSPYYFHKFLAVFLTVGIWVKLIFRLINNDLNFGEGVGRFTKTPQEFDHLMIFIIVGILGFVATTFLVNHFFRCKEKTEVVPSEGFVKWYSKYRIWLMLAWVVVFIVCGYINMTYKIYQRGAISHSSSFLVRGFFAWELVFGFSALTTVFAFYDSRLKKNLVLSHVLIFFEACISSVSLMSRGFILNAGSVMLATLKVFKTTRLITKTSLALIFLAFCIFFVMSTKVVTATRVVGFEARKDSTNVGLVSQQIVAGKSKFGSTLMNLLIDRWVGIEGIMGGLSYKGDRNQAFANIWDEKMQAGTSYYDREVLSSYYANNMGAYETEQQRQYVTIPGFLGWMSVLDNLFYVFLAAMGISLVFTAVEVLAVKLTGNIFLIALIGQVMAYRVSHFGYLPKQTYMLFSTLIFTIVLIGLIDRFLMKFKFKN